MCLYKVLLGLYRVRSESKNAYFVVNGKIQFTEIVCAEIRLIFYTYASFISTLELDLAPCSVEWNQASHYRVDSKMRLKNVPYKMHAINVMTKMTYEIKMSK